MEPLMAIAKAYNLLIIEDAAQAHGAEYRGRRAGSFGTACFSLYPTKNITSAEGGMITTANEQIAERCRVLRQHGMRRRYYHDELGFNFRMTDIHAAIGLAQLHKMEQFTQARIRNAAFLSQHLAGVVTPTTPAGYRHVFHQYTIRVGQGRRDAVLDGLTKRGIGCGVYYPVPLHRQRVYLDLGYNGSFPEAERAAQEVISLPVHPGLSSADLETIIAAVNELCS
jgi:dTDP-4-amino-4,6-dideoxygalactose transaminase